MSDSPIFALRILAIVIAGKASGDLRIGKILCPIKIIALGRIIVLTSKLAFARLWWVLHRVASLSRQARAEKDEENDELKYCSHALSEEQKGGRPQRPGVPPAGGGDCQRFRHFFIIGKS